MSRTVWKYDIPITGADVAVPRGGQVVHVASQDTARPDLVSVWVEVDPDAADGATTLRRFRVIGTGHPVPDTEEDFAMFVGTALALRGTLVWHVYELQDRGALNR